MNVVEVKWGVWFKLQMNDKTYFSILCQVGRGSTGLDIEWSENLETDMILKGLNQEQYIEHIISNFHLYKSKQVSNCIHDQINQAITEYNANNE
jgi:hypothetical protein